MPAFSLMNDDKAVIRLIGQVHRTGDKFNLMLHEAAFNCVAHVVNHGDVRLLQRLHDGLSLRVRLALASWAVRHCPKIKYDTKANSFGVRKAKDGEGTDMALLQDISPLDFVPAKKARTPSTFNFKGELEKLLKKAIDKQPDASRAIGLVRQAITAAS